MVRIAVILSLVVAKALLGCPGWLSSPDTCYWLKASTYSFFHASWWHLAVNCLAAWTIFAPKKRDNVLSLALGLVIAVIVYPLSFRPVVGISNILYAVIGMRTPAFSNPWWKSAPVIVFLVVTVLMVFLPQVSAVTHIASFLLGVAIASFRRWNARIERDVRKCL